jgi:hypothetical protein
MIALDLFAAIMAADLTNRAQIVLAEVLSQCYGPRKRESVHIDPPTLEGYSGLHRNNVRRAVRELEEAGILAKQPDGSHSFVKDYERWCPGGEPMASRLGGSVLRFATSTVTRHGISSKQPISGKPNPTGLRPTTVTESNWIASDNCNRIQLDCGDAAPPTTPIGERTRDSERERDKELDQARGQASEQWGIVGDDEPFVTQADCDEVVEAGKRRRRVIELAETMLGASASRWVGQYGLTKDCPDHEKLEQAIKEAKVRLDSGETPRGSMGSFIRWIYNQIGQPGSEYEANRHRPETQEDRRLAGIRRSLQLAKERGMMP